MSNTTLDHSSTYQRIVIMCFIAAMSAALLPNVRTDATEANDGATRLYPGAQCQPTDAANAPFHLPSGTFNFTPNAFDVTCPIIRFQVKSRSGAQVSIHVRRTSPRLSFVNCSLISLRAGGLEGVDFDSQRTVTNASIEVLHLNVDTSVPHGSYAIDCFLPPDYGIVKYEVTE